LDKRVDITKVKQVMRLRGIDKLGLTDEDRNVLTALYDGPKSAQTLAAILGYDNDNNIKVEIEPYLIRQGYIERTPRGRSLSPKGYGYVDSLVAPDGA
jgi:Holliday junction DNA helicase RuvB